MRAAQLEKAYYMLREIALKKSDLKDKYKTL